MNKSDQKTITQLKAEKRRLESELNRILGNNRVTRLQSALTPKVDNFPEIKRKLKNINLQIEKINSGKMMPRTPPGKDQKAQEEGDQAFSKNDDLLKEAERVDDLLPNNSPRISNK